MTPNPPVTVSVRAEESLPDEWQDTTSPPRSLVRCTSMYQEAISRTEFCRHS